MRNRLITLGLGVLLVAGVGLGPAQATSGQAEAEDGFVSLINQERVARGLPALQSYWDLVDDARAHSVDMAAAGDIWHNPGLASVTDGWSWLGENVGMGPGVEVLHQAFMDSPPHQDNILGSQFNYIGVGVSIDAEDTIFVTVVFMAGPDGLSDSYTPLFRDDDHSVHEASINALAEVGITQGCNPPDNDHFCPDDSLTRGQMAAFLVRALGLPPGPDRFVDDGSSVFQADINALAAAGTTKGCGPDRFCPDRYLTRGELAAFLTRGLGLPASGVDHFGDDATSVFQADINALAAAGISQGCGPGSFCPDRPVTRAEMASFLARALDQ